MNPGIFGGSISGLSGRGDKVITAPYIFREYTSSTTFIAPGPGIVHILAIGSGGTGGSAVTGPGVATKATGGGGAGLSIATRRILKPTPISILIGAGASSATRGNVGSNNGNPGNATTVSWDSNRIIAGGGFGGRGNHGSDAALSGGLGGTASGGDINITGGRGGDIAATSGHLGGLATGGGSVSLFGVQYNGGDITTNLTGNNPAGTGGAGIGGNGGNITNASASSGGGGCNGNAANMFGNGSGSGGSGISYGFMSSAILNFLGVHALISPGTGGGTNVQPPAGAGGGSGASYNNSTDAQGVSGATVLGGSGGATNGINSTADIFSGYAQFGGGGGGGASTNATTGTTFGGPATGPGAVWLFFYPEGR